MSEHNKIVPLQEYPHSRELAQTGSRDLSTDFRNIVDTDSDLLDIKQLWRYILRHKKLIIVATLLSGLIAFAANKILLPTYQSTAVIRINPTSSLFGEGYEQSNNWGRNRTFIGEQIRIISGSAVAERVIELLNLHQDPEMTGKINQRGFFNGLKQVQGLFARKNKPETLKSDHDELTAEQRQVLNSREITINRFKSKLQVKEDEETGLLLVTYESFSPKQSADIANTVIKGYQQIDEENARESKLQSQNALQSKLQEVQGKLEDSERKLTAYSRKSGISDLEDRGSIEFQKIQQLNKEFLNAQSETIKLSTLLNFYEQNSDKVVLSAVISDPIISQTKKQISELKIKYRQMLQIYQPSYPQLQQIEMDIKDLENNIKSYENEYVSGLKTQLQAATDREIRIKQELVKQNDDLLNLKDNSIDYNILKREWESNKQLYEGLLERVKQSGVASDLQLARVTTIEKASIPLDPSSPNVKKNTVTFALVGLFISLGIAALLGLFDRRIRSPEDLAEIIRYPNLAIVPLVVEQGKNRIKSMDGLRKSKNKTGKLKEVKEGGFTDIQRIELSVHHLPSSIFSETFRGLRTGLTYSLPGGFPKTLMITSSLPSEAKTTTITNLALVLNKTEKKNVLIIDLDLRKPRIHKVFGIPSSPGVTDCLVDAEIDIPVYRSKQLGISILPAGTLSQNTTEMLESAEFDFLFSKLKKKFDLIFIDAPPVMGMADSLIISTRADAVLMAISSERSTIDSVKSSISKLETVGAHIVGTVMTKFDMKNEGSSGYYYQNHYQYDYSYGGESESS